MPAVKLLGGADLGNARGINFADPSSNTDAATKQYVDNLLAGLTWKQPVRVATTTNGTLASAYANGSAVDGVTLTTGMRILLKDQTTTSENGIYTVNASGAPTRAVDADATSELQNAAVYVVAGTVNADKGFVQTTNDITPGTTAQTWVQFNAGQAYTAADDTIIVSGTTLAVRKKASGGISSDGTNGLQIDPTYSGLAKRYAADCAATTNPQTFTHNLGTSDVDPVVRIKSTGEVVLAVCTVVDANNVSVDFGGAPTAAQYRVFVAA